VWLGREFNDAKLYLSISIENNLEGKRFKKIRVNKGSS